MAEVRRQTNGAMNTTLENLLHSWLLSAAQCPVSKSLSGHLVMGDPKLSIPHTDFFPGYEPGVWAAEMLVVHGHRGHQQDLCLEHVKWPKKPGPWGSSQSCSEGHEDAIPISLFSFQFGK